MKKWWRHTETFRFFLPPPCCDVEHQILCFTCKKKKNYQIYFGNNISFNCRSVSILSYEGTRRRLSSSAHLWPIRSRQEDKNHVHSQGAVWIRC